MSYEYITDNNIEHRLSYQYSTYNGETFLHEYYESRKSILAKMNTKGNHIIYSVNKLSLAYADYLLKSFEVRKVFYNKYTSKGQPIISENTDDYDLYLEFAKVMECEYMETSCLKYLNALIKVIDTIISVHEKLNETQKEVAEMLICSELDFVKGLENKVTAKGKMHIKSNENDADIFEEHNTEYIRLRNVSMLCANTARSKAYAQVLFNENIIVNKCYIMCENVKLLEKEAEKYQPSKTKKGGGKY